MDERKPVDLDAIIHRATTGPCFICEIVRRNPDFAHHIVDEDDETIIFLSKYPTLRGYCLVCPKAHREDLAEDLSAAEYLALQAKVHRLSRVLKRMFGAERIYVLSLGSQQTNRHLHFHVAPLPEGVPLERQQYHALMAEYGTLQIADAEMARMARAIGEAYREGGPAPG
jgi:histidine triad (HIT) family protein